MLTVNNEVLPQSAESQLKVSGTDKLALDWDEACKLLEHVGGIADVYKPELAVTMKVIN